VRVTGRTGVLLPVHATAGGKILLAAGLGEADGLILRRLTGATITSRRAFEDELTDIRRLGYAINRGESLDGLHAVAVSIVDRSGKTMASPSHSMLSTPHSAAPCISGAQGNKRRNRPGSASTISSADDHSRGGSWRRSSRLRVPTAISACLQTPLGIPVVPPVYSTERSSGDGTALTSGEALCNTVS
jgi:hypothetical protein